MTASCWRRMTLKNFMAGTGMLKHAKWDSEIWTNIFKGPHASSREKQQRLPCLFEWFYQRKGSGPPPRGDICACRSRLAEKATDCTKSYQRTGIASSCLCVWQGKGCLRKSGRIELDKRKDLSIGDVEAWGMIKRNFEAVLGAQLIRLQKAYNTKNYIWLLAIFLIPRLLIFFSETRPVYHESGDSKAYPRRDQKFGSRVRRLSWNFS